MWRQVFITLFNHKKIAVTIACLCTAIIFVACLLPASNVPRVRIPYMDKLVHAIAFAGFAGAWLFTFTTIKKSTYITIGIITAIIGTIIEFLQISPITYGRSFELADIIADTIGGIIGISVFAYFYHKIYPSR